MKILIFADLHYFGEGVPQFDTSEKLVQYAEPMLEELIKKANFYDVDFVVNMGDIIQDRNDKEKDIESLEYIYERLKEFNRPCYSVLGNHDMKMMDSKKEVEDILGYETTYSFDRDGFHFVFLTTDINPEADYKRGGILRTFVMPESTLKWLEKDLADNKLPCVIFTHYALPDDDSLEDECCFLKNRAEVKKVISVHDNIIAVFNGHQHVTKTYKENEITYHLIGSPTAPYPDKVGVPCGVYAIIEFDGKEINISIENISL